MNTDPATPEAIEAYARRIAGHAWLPVMFTTTDANLRRDCKRRREESLRIAAAVLNNTKEVPCKETTA